MKRRVFLQSAIAAAVATALPRHYVLAAASALPSSLDAVSGDGKTVSLSQGALSELRAALRGNLLFAGDDGYDQARQILNPSFDKHPALVVQPTGVADIQAAVDFARDNGGLLLAVKCGGHSYSGKSTCEKGMLIDLSHFRHVHVDPSSRTAWVAGGSLLGELDHEAMAHGLVTPMGTVSHTGAGGLVTGGGFGRLARRYGLSIDNLKSVDVVSADGKLRHASADENPDLFWGVRGGGGNFGIVTTFELELHPMQRQVIGGRMAFPLDRARQALELYRDNAGKSPDELSLGMGLVKPPGDVPGFVNMSVCWSGPESGYERAMAPFASLGEPMRSDVGAIDYVALQRSGDMDDPRAVGTYLKSGFVPELSQELVSALVDGFPGDPSRQTLVFFQESGGAISRVAPDATAFSQRDAFGNLLVIAGWPFGQPADAHVQAVREYWAKLEPHTHGFYVNDLDPEASGKAIQENYRRNLERLVAVKNSYDPDNLFRLNANIRPTA